MSGVLSLLSPLQGLTTGYPDRIDTSEQLGRPGGIESIFEYNGTLLNVRTWFDTFLVNQIEGFADPDVRDSREVNPGRHGETPFAAYYGGRTIVLTGKIRAMTLAKMRNMEMGLKQTFGDISREFPLVIRTGNPAKDVMIYCKKSQPITMTEMQQDETYRRDFQITLRASRPFFISFLETQVTAAFDLGFRETFDTDALVAFTNIIQNTSGQNGSTDYTALTTNSEAPTAGAISAIGGSSGIRGTWTNPGPSRIYDPVAPPPYNTEWDWRDNTGLAIAYRRLPYVRGDTYSFSGVFSYAVSGRTTIPVIYVGFDIRGYSAGGVELVRSNAFYSGYGRVEIPFYDRPASKQGIVVRGYGSTTSYAGYTEPAYIAACATVWLADTRLRTIGGKPPRQAGNADAGTGTFVLEVQDFTFGYKTAGFTIDPFDGETSFARWLGASGRSNSEFVSSTGLEGKYSFLTGNGNASVRSGKIYANANGQYVRLKRENVSRIRSYTSLLEINTGNPAVPTTGTVAQYKIIDNSNWLLGALIINGASSRLMIGTETIGLPITSLRESSAFSVAANTTYWIRTIFARNVVTVELWTAHPDLGGSATQTLSYTLAGGDATRFGQDVVGESGIGFPSGTNFMFASLDNHQITPAANQTDLTIDLNNNGNAPADPIIRLYGLLNSTIAGGQAATLRWKVPGKTPKDLTITAPPGSTVAIPAGNYIEIDVARRTLKLYDSSNVFVANVYNQLDVSSEWWALDPGENPIVFLMYSTGSPRVIIRHRHTYY